jgi:predicted DNA-binding protein
MTDAPNFTKPWPLSGSQVSIRFRPELIERVDSMAKRAGVSRTLVVNRMIQWALSCVAETEDAE